MTNLAALIAVARWEVGTLFRAFGALAIRTTALTAAFAIGLVFVHWGRPIRIVDLIDPFYLATNAVDLRATIVNIVSIAVLSCTTTGIEVLNGRRDELWLRLARGYITIAIITVIVFVLASLSQISLISLLNDTEISLDDSAIARLSGPARALIPLVFGIELAACLARIVNERHMKFETTR